MKNTSAARKYARALFNHAVEKQALRACQQGLEEVVRLCRLSQGIFKGMSHPFIGASEKRQVLSSVLGEHSTPLLQRFFAMLVERGRFNLVFAIKREFQDLVNRRERLEPVTIQSPFPVSAGEQKAVAQALEKWLGVHVKLTYQHDASLIGGWVVQTRDYVLDQSLKGQLQRLQGTLAH